MSDLKDRQEHLITEALRLLNERYEANQPFNEFFDGDEPLTISSPRDDVEDYRYEQSKVLFWVDREAYEDERDAWDNKTLQEQHQDAIDLLSANGHVAPFHELVEAVSRQRIVPFVGAGLSLPMAMPLWGVALQLLHDRIHNPNDPNISALINEGRYLEAAQELAAHNLVLVNNFIRTTYRVQKLDGPMLLLPRIAHGCIVTTNFDNAIEKVFEIEQLNFDSYMHGTQHHNFFSRLVRGQRCLLKLHGDADDPQTYILTLEQYTEAYHDPWDFHLPLPKALRQIFISNSLLFLGCSLDRDWTLELFKNVKEQSEYEIPNHYAFLPAPDDLQARQQKETMLLELNIQPIWYPAGRHEFVEKLLRLVIDVADKRMALGR
jgi:SIR2-like protein